MNGTQTFQKVSAHVVREANDRMMTVNVNPSAHDLSTFPSILRECEERSSSEAQGLPLVIQHVIWLKTGQKLFSTPLTREAIERAGTNAMLKLRR